jgi:hypothetical protein
LPAGFVGVIGVEGFVGCDVEDPAGLLGVPLPGRVVLPSRRLIKPPCSTPVNIS